MQGSAGVATVGDVEAAGVRDLQDIPALGKTMKICTRPASAAGAAVQRTGVGKGAALGTTGSIPRAGAMVKVNSTSYVLVTHAF